MSRWDGNKHWPTGIETLLLAAIAGRDALTLRELWLAVCGLGILQSEHRMQHALYNLIGKGLVKSDNVPRGARYRLSDRGEKTIEAMKLVWDVWTAFGTTRPSIENIYMVMS